MKIDIEDSKTLLEIQQEFSGIFPYLKIEFFSKPHSVGKGTEKKFMRSGQEKLNEVAARVNGKTLDIDPEMSVAELERTFDEKFGLHVQVFRRSGKLWLETTATDDWTLNYQNEQGRELSGSVGNSSEPIDYQKQE